jgi:hypothetical protein
MSRLYYESERTAQSVPGGEFDTSKRGFKLERADSDSEVKSFLEKVAKLVPSEVIAGYITLVGFISASRNASIKVPLYGIAFILCLMLTPIYLNSQAEPNKPKRTHLVLSTLAFIIWAYATSGQQIIPSIYDPAVGSCALVAFSLVSGVIPLRS